MKNKLKGKKTAKCLYCSKRVEVRNESLLTHLNGGGIKIKCLGSGISEQQNNKQRDLIELCLKEDK